MNKSQALRAIQQIPLVRRAVVSLSESGVLGSAKEGRLGVDTLGHREYVGGNWEQVGEHQLAFMKRRGLQPQHVLADVACGALRGGAKFIAYLDPGNYLGIEKEAALVKRGIDVELPSELHEEKSPEIVVSPSFEFHLFSKAPDYSLAHSLFSHLNLDEIALCLQNLRAIVSPGSEFYASFFRSKSESPNYQTSHAHRSFLYTTQQMSGMGVETGWAADFLGGWGHDGGQVMMRYVAH